MESQKKFVNVLLTIIAFIGLFGLTSYFMNKQQTPKPQKTLAPVHKSVRQPAVIKSASISEVIPKQKKALRPVRVSAHQISSLKTELKETKAAYKHLLNKHDSLKQVAETLQKPTQKAESGREK